MWDIAWAGSTVYLAGLDELQIVDVRNATRPTLVGATPSGGPAAAVTGTG